VAVLDLPIPDGEARKLALLVHAAEQKEARAHVDALFRALRPDRELAECDIVWETTDRLQGRRPPGIYAARIE
jgi:hypothetical protein